MQVVPKWKVTARLPEGKEVVFWMHDGFATNVLAKVASMQFTENGLNQPHTIIVELATQA